MQSPMPLLSPKRQPPTSRPSLRGKRTSCVSSSSDCSNYKPIGCIRSTICGYEKWLRRKELAKKCAAYPTPHRTGQKSVRRTLRRKELAQRVCGVPYAAKNWPKKCAAYPTPQRTGQKSVRRTLRRIELAKKVCGVPYAA